MPFLIVKMCFQIVQRARTAFQNGRTKNLDFREGQMKALLRMYEENEYVFLDALKADLHKVCFLIWEVS